MPLFLINVGHNCPVTGSEFPAAHVAQVLTDAGWYPLAVHQSDSEATTVAIIGTGHSIAYLAARRVCEALRQDCVAMYNPRNGKGELIGHKASAWGEFHPEYFLLANGSKAK